MLLATTGSTRVPVTPTFSGLCVCHLHWLDESGANELVHHHLANVLGNICWEWSEGRMTGCTRHHGRFGRGERVTTASTHRIGLHIQSVQQLHGVVVARCQGSPLASLRRSEDKRADWQLI